MDAMAMEMFEEYFSAHNGHNTHAPGSCSFKNNSMDLHSLHKVIRKGSRLSLTHLLSLVPHLREVRALVNVHNLPRPLLQSIIMPSAPDAQEELQLQSQDRLPRSLHGYLNGSFNEPQQEVRHSLILSCLPIRRTLETV